MHLTIDNAQRELTPLAVFQQTHNLPPTFGVAAFQPKQQAGLGSIDGAGPALGSVREAILSALPAGVAAAGWLAVVPRLAATFEAALIRVNHRVGLREPEIAFAVSGFEDVCSAYGLALFRATATASDAPAFDDVYRDWLAGTLRLSGEQAPYPHNGELWRVWVISHAYGRIGLKVQTASETHYIADTALICPATGFMVHTLRAVAAQMEAATL